MSIASVDWHLQHEIDYTRGASGSGLLQQLFINVGDPSWYWVGPNTHEAAPHLWPNNRTRRLTWSLWGFIGDNTTEW